MTFTTGPVISGTLRPQDLAPAFLTTLEDVDPTIIGTEDHDNWRRWVARICATDGEWDGTSETLADLMDAINAALPTGYWFGTAEGDGAEFGIWENDDTPRCDICGTADEAAPAWCGSCGCCQEHCQHLHGCDWVIVCVGEQDDPSEGSLYWSNEDGWVSRDSATVFTYNEQMALNLPLDGAWMYA